MTNLTIGKPDETEYLPYYGRYIALVPDGDVLARLSAQVDETVALLRGIPEAQAGFPFAPDNWRIRVLFGHVIGTELIFASRALRLARNDRKPEARYEHDDY